MSTIHQPTASELKTQIDALQTQSSEPPQPTVGGFHSGDSQIAARPDAVGGFHSGDPQFRPAGGRPPKLDEFRRGQLVICLAAGLTQRETGMWIETSQSNVSYLFRKDPGIQDEVKHYTELARLHPLLRLYQFAGKSWKAASRLLLSIESRRGPLTTDELIAALKLMREKVQRTIMPKVPDEN